jgi:ferredoxin
MVKIRFEGRVEGTVEQDPGVSLLAAALGTNLPLKHRCGGHARCGTCRAIVEEGAEHLSPMADIERQVLEILGADPRERLCCQSLARGDIHLRV